MKTTSAATKNDKTGRRTCKKGNSTFLYIHFLVGKHKKFVQSCIICWIHLIEHHRIVKIVSLFSCRYSCNYSTDVNGGPVSLQLARRCAVWVSTAAGAQVVSHLSSCTALQDTLTHLFHPLPTKKLPMLQPPHWFCWRSYFCPRRLPQ